MFVTLTRDAVFPPQGHHLLRDGLMCKAGDAVELPDDLAESYIAMGFAKPGRDKMMRRGTVKSL